MQTHRHSSAKEPPSSPFSAKEPSSSPFSAERLLSRELSAAFVQLKHGDSVRIGDRAGSSTASADSVGSHGDGGRDFFLPYITNSATLDGCRTSTSDEQQHCEGGCISFYAKVLQGASAREVEASDSLVCLKRDAHCRYLLNALEFPLLSTSIYLDSSRAWVLFWTTHSLSLLDNLNSDKWGPRIVRFAEALWDDEQGGFAGGPNQLAHLAPTYAAVASLVISGHPEAYELLDRLRPNLLAFLVRQRESRNGGFCVHENGEVDMRGAYCAVAVASLLQMVSDDLVDGLAEYIASCQTWEGGISGEPGMEAHGGYTYCGLATLCLLKKAHLLDLDLLLEWACNRQMGLEGGFQGRTNKHVDSCYSFWIGALFPLLRCAFEQAGRTVPSDHSWFSAKPLQLYILVCCQSERGGLRDKPGKPSDLYHTCYALSGLSVSQAAIAPYVFGPSSNRLLPTDPLYNVRTDLLERAKSYFSAHPFQATEKGPR